MAAIGERVASLEGAYEQVDKRLDDMNRPLNTILVLLCGSWVTIIAAIIGLYFKG